MGSTSTALLFRGADSSSGTPSSSNNPSTYLETVRTGGTNGTARFGWNYHYQVTGQSAADNYPHYIFFDFAPDMTGTPSNNYFHEGSRIYMLGAPFGITGQSIHGYARTVQAERQSAGWRLIADYIEVRNSAATDANVLDSSIDTTYGLVASIGGVAHNTGLLFVEGPSNATSFYYGIKFGSNSLAQRGFDLSATTFTLQGSWAATNGSAVVSGSGGHAAVEVVQGDWLLVNGTYARAASATANAITLSATFAGSTGSSLTITKSVQSMWLRENQSILSLNHAGTAKNEILRYDEADHIRLDYDGVGTITGGYLSFGTNAIAAPSDTITSGYRLITYNGGAGFRYGLGVEPGYSWYMASGGHRLYVNNSVSPVLALSVEDDRSVRFYEDSANGSNYIGLKAPANLSANTSFTLPTGDGTVNQVLKTNGSGVLSWADNLSGGAPVDATYLLFSSNLGLTNSRTLVGTAGQITLTDGGAGGAYTLSIPAAASITTSLTVPTMYGGANAGSSLNISGTSGTPGGAQGHIFLNSGYTTGTGAVVIGGTTTATTGAYKLDLQDTGIAQLRILSTNAVAGAGSAGIQSGVSTLPSAADQRLAFYTFGAANGITGTLANGAAVSGFSAEAWADASTPHGAYIKFETTIAGGTSRAERWRIDDVGNLGSSGRTFASLGSPADGRMVYCSDCKDVAHDGAAAGSVAVTGGGGAWVFREQGAWRIFY